MLIQTVDKMTDPDLLGIGEQVTCVDEFAYKYR